MRLRGHVDQIRTSTVLGIVGADGIGFVLNEAMRRLDRARVALLFFVIPGSRALSELSSAWVRERLT